MVHEISPVELKARLDNGQHIILIEALPQRYFDESHLPGAINIPHEDIQAQAATRLPDKEAEIVVYCANTACQNSRIAAQTLEREGYSNVFEFVGGKQAWEEAGYPLES